MPETLLRTKLFVPPLLPNHVPRAHLLDKLDQGLQFGRKLALISAPAGYGKTTLAAAWHNRLAQPPMASARVAWLALDEDDNDPLQFFTYVLAALEPNVPSLDALLQSLLASAQLPLAQLIPQLVNALSERQQPLLLMLDDYHCISNATIHRSLTQFIDYLPPGTQVLLTTRRDPPLPLPRWRVRGQLLEIREQDLQFDRGETARFMKECMGVTLNSTDVTTLTSRTEGWIASLQLAGLSLQRLTRPHERHQFVSNFGGSHRYVVDYLLDDVLSQQPPGSRDFLLQTAVLPRMSADLCNTVTQRPDGQAMLEQLDSANLFIIALDQERRWYRYHHLFATLLRQRLRQQHPAWVLDLYERASVWFADNGFTAEAIDMALQADDSNRAAALLQRIAATTVWQQGQYVRLARWIDQLPEAVMARYAQLCVYYAWGLLVDVDRANALAATRWLALAEQHSPGDAAEQRDIRGQIAAIRASRTRVQAQVATTVRHVDYALEHLRPKSTFWQALSYFNLAAVRFLGDDADAVEAALNACEATARAADDRLMQIAVVNFRSQFQVRYGRLSAAAELFERTLSAEGHQDPNQPVFFTSGMSSLGLGCLYLEWNQLDRAAELLAQGLEIGRITHHPITLISGQLAMAQLKVATGEPDAARRLIRETNQMTATTGINWTWLTGPTSAAEARLWLRLGDMASARAALQGAQPAQAVEAGAFGFWQECQDLAHGRLLLAKTQPQAALELLHRLETDARRAGRNGSLVEILILTALARQALGENKAARGVLSDVLELAQPAGYVRTFLDAGQPFGQMLASLPATPYRDQLLAAFGWLADAGAADQSALVEPLSERELQILRLMAARLSNREIADQLYLATTTIKWYSRQIYGKLGVNSRGQAVARARTLKIL